MIFTFLIRDECKPNRVTEENVNQYEGEIALLNWEVQLPFQDTRLIYLVFFVLVFFCGVGLTSPGTAATSGLLYSPR
jgi:hypothetical protein